MIIYGLFFITSAHAAPWYYPDATDTRAPISDAFQLSQRVVVGLDEGEDVPSHPDIVAVRWLSVDPAVLTLTVRPDADPLAVSRDLHDRDTIRWRTQILFTNRSIM